MSEIDYSFVFEEKKETSSVFGLNWMRKQEDWTSGFEKHQEYYDNVLKWYQVLIILFKIRFKNAEF